MNQIVANLTNAVTNLHVSAPVALGAGIALAQIWFPQHATALNATAGVLASYGIIAASNTPAEKQTTVTPPTK